MLAVGSLPRKLSLPGTDLDVVHYLRNIADVDRNRAGVAEGGRAVVIGGGYIGLKVSGVELDSGDTIDASLAVVEINAAALSDEYTDFQIEELINLGPQVNNIGDVDLVHRCSSSTLDTPQFRGQ